MFDSGPHYAHATIICGCPIFVGSIIWIGSLIMVIFGCICSAQLGDSAPNDWCTDDGGSVALIVVGLIVLIGSTLFNICLWVYCIVVAR